MGMYYITHNNPQNLHAKLSSKLNATTITYRVYRTFKTPIQLSSHCVNALDKQVHEEGKTSQLQVVEPSEQNAFQRFPGKGRYST